MQIASYNFTMKGDQWHDRNLDLDLAVVVHCHAIINGALDLSHLWRRRQETGMCSARAVERVIGFLARVSSAAAAAMFPSPPLGGPH